MNRSHGDLGDIFSLPSKMLILKGGLMFQLKQNAQYHTLHVMRR
jgi:hypothetical protein